MWLAFVENLRYVLDVQKKLKAAKEAVQISSARLTQEKHEHTLARRHIEHLEERNALLQDALSTQSVLYSVAANALARERMK